MWATRPARESTGRAIARAAPPKVLAVDTTGAGDAFNGAFLARYLRDKKLNR